MSAACSDWTEGAAPTPKCGESRDFVGSVPPPGHLSRNGTDDSELKVALIAMRNERALARVALNYELSGYRCVRCSPDWFSVSRNCASIDGRSSLTVVTDDEDLMIDIRCREGIDALPIHAVVEDTGALAWSPILAADEFDVEVNEGGS